jgi:glycosyltransferase involved in cell wall biosynthesis
MPDFAAEIARHWARRRPDVAHAHFWMSGLAVAIAARSLEIPTALTFHALGVEKQRHQRGKDTSPPERVGLEQWLACSVDRVLATSNSEVFELLRMGAPKPALRVVPCGVDTDAFRPRGPVWDRHRGRPRIGVVSRLVERKGIGNVIEALAQVPDAELVVAGGPPRLHLGDDPEARRLWARAEAAGVADRVRFVGSVARSAVPAMLRSCDLVVCAPWYEPFGLVPLEAMACGVPVVGTAVGGIVDTVIHGETGLLVPPRDPVALARAMRDVLSDTPLRAAMGRAGAERARAFSWSRIAEATLAAYPSTAAAGTGERMASAR